jgi:hypothetical protein
MKAVHQSQPATLKAGPNLAMVGASMKRFGCGFLVVLCLTVVGGCRRGVKSHEFYDLEKGKLKAVYLPAGREIQVEFSTKDNVPVNAILVSKEDADAAVDAVSAKGNIDAALKAVKKQIAMKPNAASGTLSCPKTEDATVWAILFTTNKATTITVKTAGK